MDQPIVKGCVSLLLAWNAVADWKKREISLESLALFGAVGLGLNFKAPYQGAGEGLGGVGVGLCLLLLAFLTKEAVGFGDGFLLCVTGIYLGFWENLRLLTTGLLLCALVLGAGLVFRRLRPAERFPLVPFLFLAWLGRLFL